ncbi:MAG: hypothetical protein EAZ14_11485 [Runella slithyformis]|nr:MAG: hypothetical protein EAZ14_11485 [Runella slithyformis]
MKETENWQPRTQIKLDGVEFERQGVLPITKTFLADCTHNLAYGHNIAAMYEFWKCIERMFPFDLVNEDNDSIKKYNQYLRINYVINKERYDSLCTLDSEKYESDLETYLTHCTNEKLRKLMFNEMSAFCFRYPNNAGLSFLIEDINILIAGSEYTLKSLREFKEGLISNSQTLSYNFFYPTADGRCFWGIHLDQKGVFKWFHIVNIRTQMQNYLDWLLDLRQTIDKIIQPQPATASHPARW